MKKISLLLTVLAFALVPITLMAQEEGGRPEGPGGPQGPGGQKFMPTLNGVWQLCTFSQGEDGRPQMSLLPVLKIINEETSFQHIGIHSGGSCFIEKQGTIQKTSDSTYVETEAKAPFDSIAPTPLQVHFNLHGPMWLSVDYQAPGAQEVTHEFWLRVRPMNHDRKEGGHKPGMQGQRPNRPQGARGQRGQQRNQNATNPFEQTNTESNGAFENSDSVFD